MKIESTTYLTSIFTTLTTVLHSLLYTYDNKQQSFMNTTTVRWSRITQNVERNMSGKTDKHDAVMYVPVVGRVATLKVTLPSVLNDR